MNVLASFTENASEKMTELYQQDPNMIDMLTTSAFENATEQDIGMMSDMMQNSTGGNTAMLMQSMVAYNPEMVADVYNDLAEQDYDLFEHIESAKMDMQTDPYYDPGAYDPGADPYYDPGMPEDMQTGAMYYQEQFFDDLKGEIFSEIMTYGEGTASEIASDLMMNTGGNSAMFMMENMMHENPEMMAQVMDNFMQEDFDIFYHMEEPTYDPALDPAYMADPTYDPATDPTYDPALDPAYDPAYDTAYMDEMKDFQQNIIGTMMDYGGEEAMETMAYMMSTGDAENSAFILESVMEHTMMDPMMMGDMYYDPYMMSDPYAMDPTMMDPAYDMGQEQNLALALLDEMGEMDPNMMADLYEQQTDLMDNMFEEAFSNASEEDASMIADIMSSEYASEDMATMMFDHLADMEGDQNFMTEVFNDIAEQSPETLIAMAEMDQGLYENMASDPYYEGDMSTGDLMQDIMTAAGYDPYMDPMMMGDMYYDPYMDPMMMGDMYYDPYMDPMMMGDMYYDPYMDPMMMGDTYYDPYMDPMMMGDMYYDPYMDPYYDPYYDPMMMGDMYYDPYYYDPYFMVDDDDPATTATEEIDTSYNGYSSYAEWCAATTCTTVAGEPTWSTTAGSLGYSSGRAFFPGSVINLSLSATSQNSSNIQYAVSSGLLPPGLNLNSDMASIEGTITPADALDTITFDGNTATFNITKTAAPVTLDAITFDGTDTYDLTQTVSTDTLDSPYFDGMERTFYLTENTMMDDYTPADPQFLTVVVDGVTQDASTYTIGTNFMGRPIITFDNPPAMSATSTITYAEKTAYTPTADENLAVTIDSVVQNPSTYTITGSQIVFNSAKSAPTTTTLDTITFDGTDTYDLQTSVTTTLSPITFDGSAATLDTITFDGTDTYDLTQGSTVTSLSPITFDGSTATLDAITFDGTDTYDLTQTGSTDTLDSPYFDGMGRTFYLTENTMMDDYTPADPQFLTVVVDGVTQDASTYTIGTDMMGRPIITFDNPPAMMASSTITYAEKTAYTPTDPDDIEITIDSVVQNPSTYTITGSQIAFNEIKQASATMNSIAETSVTTVSPAAEVNLNITIDGTLVPTADYTISGSQVVFDTARSAAETMTAITHSTGSTLDSIIDTEVAAFTPTASGKLTVEIDGVLQAPSTYTINGNQIIFDEAPANGVATTAFLHSEESDYTFNITATDPTNTEFSERTFSMFVNRPGIAWIAPKRGESAVNISYEQYMTQTIPLIAATSNKTGAMYNEVSLTLTADPDTIANSGLQVDTGTFDNAEGTVEGSLEGETASFAEDTEFEITIKAQETGNTSYNNERTLIINILQNPNCVSPVNNICST
jgi:hypothetical protein